MTSQNIIVFVLDVSGSMSNKIATVHTAVSSFISNYPVGHFVGLVLFNSSSWIEHPLVPITDNNRCLLVEKIPKRVSGSTDIGIGLLTGLAAILDAGLQTDGALLYLFTDGEHNSGPPYVEASLPSLKRAKVRVDFQAFGNFADGNLEQLKNETGGNLFRADENCKELALRTIASGIREALSTKEIAELKPIILFNETLKITELKAIIRVIIDKDIGRNTVFNFQSSFIEKFSVILVSPVKNKYDSSYGGFKKNTDAKTYQFDFKNAEPGFWEVQILSQSNMPILLNLLVSSRSIDNKAIKLISKINNHDQNDKLPPLVFVELENQKILFTEAKVLATFEKPDGTKIIKKLEVYQQVFWTYFTDYSIVGRYNVNIKAQNLEENGTICQFQRQEDIGSIKVEKFITWIPANESKVKNLIMTKEFKNKI